MQMSASNLRKVEGTQDVPNRGTDANIFPLLNCVSVWLPQHVCGLNVRYGLLIPSRFSHKDTKERTRLTTYAFCLPQQPETPKSTLPKLANVTAEHRILGQAE